MLFDAENHASILDASRLAMGTTFKYKHNDMENLEELLESTVGRFNNVMIVADGVFSMTGDLMNLPETISLAKNTTLSCMSMMLTASELWVIVVEGR